MSFFPISAEEMLDRGWDAADFVYVCGDAYVDHPSFGAAIICRVLENRGYKVAFLAQPGVQPLISSASGSRGSDSLFLPET